jgi:hypothetical protein
VGDFRTKIADILYTKGAAKAPYLEQMVAEGASEIHPRGPVLLSGGNARSRAQRLRKGSVTVGATLVPRFLRKDFCLMADRKRANSSQTINMHRTCCVSSS